MEDIANDTRAEDRRRRSGLMGRAVLGPRDPGIERVIHDIPTDAPDELRGWTRGLMRAVSSWEVMKCQGDGLARLQLGGR